MQDSLYDLSIALWAKPGFGNLLSCRAAPLEELASKIFNLRAIVECVGCAEGFEIAVESIEKRDPVVEITSGERPSGWEVGKSLWEGMPWCCRCVLHKRLDIRRLSRCQLILGWISIAYRTYQRLLVLWLYGLQYLDHGVDCCGNTAIWDIVVPLHCLHIGPSWRQLC